MVLSIPSLLRPGRVLLVFIQITSKLTFGGHYSLSGVYNTQVDCMWQTKTHIRGRFEPKMIELTRDRLTQICPDQKFSGEHKI